jgi:hypothetical protein
MSERLSQRVLLRYKQALRVPPRDLVRFGQRFIAEMTSSAARAETAYATLREVKEKSNVSADHWALMRKLGIAYLADTLRQVGSIADSARAAMKEGPIDRALLVIFYTAREWHNDVLAPVQQAVDKITPGVVEDYLKDHDLEWNEKYEEGMPPAEITPYYDLRMALAECILVYREAEKDWKALQPRWQTDMSALEPAKVETLYHASLVAKKLYENGFEKTIPGDVGLGLGGSKSDKAGKDATSFTYDLKYALDLARAFKELALIAHGEVTAKQILNWAKHEGTADRVADYLIHVEGGVKGAFRIKLDGGDWIVRSHTGETMGLNEFYDTPERVAIVYNAYIKHHSFRKDPFILNIQTLVRNMKSIDSAGVGVVAAEVNMEHPDIHYNPGEREIRVPPDAILRTTRFYR